jgi:hypothetical protein
MKDILNTTHFTASLLSAFLWLLECPNIRIPLFRWFMPVNIAITFFIGGSLGWIACNILKPPQHFRGLIMAFCSAGSVDYMLHYYPCTPICCWNQQWPLLTRDTCRQSWKPAIDHCPGCLLWRREPIREGSEHLPLTRVLLLVIVHGCKKNFLHHLGEVFFR